jgi:hypothetical protein
VAALKTSRNRKTQTESLQTQLSEMKEACDKALSETYGELAGTFPEVLEAALSSIFEENTFLRRNYDPDKSPLENYHASIALRGAVNPYLERHAPERIEAAKAQYTTEITALKERIAALQAG